MASQVRVDAFLAESVSQSGNRIGALGAGWNTMRVGHLPVAVGRIGLGVLTRVDGDREAARHRLAIRLEAPDGTPVPLSFPPHAGALEADLEVPALPDGAPLSERVAALAVNVDGLVLEQAGAYRFVLAVDGVDVKIVPFGVVAG